MFRIVGDVQNYRVHRAILLRDLEHYTSDQPVPHQAQVLKPHLLVADSRVPFAVDHREDHRVIFRLNILGQQCAFGCRAHGRFLTGDEVPAQLGFRGRIDRMEKPCQISLVPGTDIQFAAQVQVVPDRHIHRNSLEGTFYGGCGCEARAAVKGAISTLITFEVVQSGLEHRQRQCLE